MKPVYCAHSQNFKRVHANELFRPEGAGGGFGGGGPMGPTRCVARAHGNNASRLRQRPLYNSTQQYRNLLPPIYRPPAASAGLVAPLPTDLPTDFGLCAHQFTQFLTQIGLKPA